MKLQNRKTKKLKNPNLHLLIFGLYLVFMISACKTTKPIRPVENYAVPERFERQTSIIPIPIQLDIPKLQRSLNRQFEGALFEDDSFDDGDNMKLKASKDGNIQIKVQGMSVSYIIPLDLWIQYDVGLGKVDANGKLELEFNTLFDIGPDWRLATQTALTDYKWNATPKVRLGGINIPVESIANVVIRKSRETLTKSIDDTIAESFHLEQVMSDAWSQMFKPYLVSQEYQTWLKINPQDMGMTALEQDGNFVRSTIFIKSQPELLFGAEPITPVASLMPPFSYRSASELNNENFQIFVEATMGFEEAEQITRTSLVGERFEQGKRYVVVEDIDLYGQGNKVVVNLRLSGSYNGSIYLTGRPVFDPNNNKIAIDDLKYTLDTENFLLKSAGWLAKGTLKRKLQENMDYLLDYNLKDAQVQMQEQLDGYEITLGITMSGQLDDLSLYNAYLTATGFKVAVVLNGKIGIVMDDLMTNP